MNHTHILAPLIGAALLLTACGGGTPAPPATHTPVVQLPVVPPVQPPVTPPVTPPTTDPDHGKTLNLPTTISLNAGSSLQINLDQLSFSAGRTIQVNGLPSELKARMEGKVLIIESVTTATNTSITVQVTYGTPGSAALLSQAVTVVVKGTAAPDPDLGTEIRSETITLNDQNPSAQVSLGYLSLAGGRTIKLDNLPEGVSWSVNAATKTGTLTRKAGAPFISRNLVVKYVDASMSVIAFGEWQLNVQATPAPAYAPVTSNMATWNEVERRVVGYINEVRTNKSLNGKDVSGGACLVNFPDTTQPLLPVDAGQVAARRHAQYVTLEGVDPSVGPDGVRGHFEYNPASTAYHGFSSSDRLKRAASETPQSRAGGFGDVRENIFTMSDSGKPVGVDQLAIAAVNGWLNSPAHCPQIMDPIYRFIGVGHAYNPSAVVGSTFWQHNVVMDAFY